MKAHQLLFSLLISFLSFQSFAQNDEALYHEGQLFVKLKEGVELANSETPSREMQTFFAPFTSPFHITEVKAGFWFSKTSTNRIVRVFFDDQAETDVFIQELEASGKVEYAERIPISRKYLTPNDLGPNSTSTGGQWYLYKTRAQQAWDIQTGNSAIQVAVVDDAVQTTHPDLQGVISQSKDMVDGDADVNPPLVAWDHGTFIAGLIGAKCNNGLGMASLGNGVSIFPVKITGNQSANVLISEYEGVNYATTHGARVINMSWGSTAISQTGLQVITDAYNNGVVLVAAAGNDGTTIVNFPAGYPGVISVAATNSIDVKSSFSNYGNWIDIAAPGTQLWSLAPYDGTTIKNGTSFAAPLVSAAAAILLSAHPELTPDQVASCLISSADNIDIFNQGYIGQLGSGRLNLEQALICLEASTSQHNAWLNSMVSPSFTSCETSFTPVVRVVNTGLDTITSMTLTIKLDNGFTRTEEWTGEILPGLAEFIPLADYQAAPGNHSFLVTILPTLNGVETDEYLPNNTLFYAFQVQPSSGLGLPFNENFETVSFTTNSWTIDSPGGGASWEIGSTNGLAPGSKSARLPYYSDFLVESRDYLVSPTFNLTGYSAATLTFSYAYQQINPILTDSLIVSVSTDCGQNWNRVWARGENGNSSFATSPITGAYFIPQTAADWCGTASGMTCGTINLTPFAGTTGFRFRFEGFNNHGNNIYVDNINISGTALTTPPVAAFSADGNQETCVNANVVFSNNSTNNPTTYAWTFEGGTPATSTAFAPVVTYSTSGSYDVQLIVTKTSGSDTLMMTDYITVNERPTLSITASLDSVCTAVEIQLEAAGAVEYIWNPGNGLVSSNSPIVLVSPAFTSNYTVLGINEAGCLSSVVKQIVVLPTPPAPIITQNGFSISSTPSAHYEWYVNGVPIANSDTIDWNPTVNGNYNVRTTDQYGCTTISIPFTVNWVGIEEVNEFMLQMAPNPADKMLFIQSLETIQSLGVFSVAGQLVMNVQLAKNATYFSTEALEEGLYFLRIETSKGAITKRFVVAH